MFAFTSEDGSLLLPFSGRDPLGTQVVWQWRARDMVPALTAASREPEGFQLLLTILAWWPEFAHRYERPQKDLQNYFLLAEQAFARACKLEKQAWRLPGSRRLNDAHQSGLWIGLDSRRDFLLDDPMANGTWGIYRGPAMNAGLIGAGERLHPADAEQIIASSEVVRWLFPFIARALQNPKDQVVLVSKRSSNTSRLAQILENLPQRQLIRDAFVKPRDYPLAGKLAELTPKTEGTAEASVEQLLGHARTTLNGFAETLRNAEHCERYITAMDLAFEQLAGHSGRSLKSLADVMKIDLAVLGRAQKKFRESGAYEGLAGERYKDLASAPLDTMQALVTFLIDHHAAISASRGTAPFVLWGDTGRLESVLPAEPWDEKPLDARRVWRNSYYIDALRHLAARTKRS